MRPSEVTDLDQGGFGPRQPRERRQLVGCSLSGVPLWVFFFFLPHLMARGTSLTRT